MKIPLRLVLVVSIMASFVAFLDSSVVNVALPAISKDLGGGLAAQQWIVDAYLLSLGAFILVAGSLSDLFGRKKILAAGLTGFLVTSILCAIAPTATFLIFARALQGIAGALLVPSSLALIISVFEGPDQAKAIGKWTAWTGMAFIVGPILGGFLVDAVSWRLVFWINTIPIIITLLLLRVMKLKEKLPKDVHIDIVGVMLCIIGLGGPVYAFIEQPNYGWSSPMVYVPLIIGIIASVGFIINEMRTKYPMLPLELFKVRNFAVGNLATIAIYAGLSVATFTVVLFVQQVAGYSAFNAGLTLLPITLIMFVFSPIFGGLAGKYGPRLFMTVGPMLSAVGFASFLSVNDSINFWSQLLPGILLFGLGLSITVAPLTSAVLGDIDKTHAGVGSAINNAVSRVAGLIAIALIGLVIGADAFTTGSITYGVEAFHKAAIVMAALLFLGGLISLIGIRNNQPLNKTS